MHSSSKRVGVAQKNNASAPFRNQKPGKGNVTRSTRGRAELLPAGIAGGYVVPSNSQITPGFLQATKFMASYLNARFVQQITADHCAGRKLLYSDPLMCMGASVAGMLQGNSFSKTLRNPFANKRN